MSLEDFSSFFPSQERREGTSSNSQDAPSDGSDLGREKHVPNSSFNRNDFRLRDGEERGDGGDEYERNNLRYRQRTRRFEDRRPYANESSYQRRNDYAKSRRPAEFADGDSYSRRFSQTREYDRYERRTYSNRFNGASDYERPREPYKRSWHDQRPNDEGRATNSRPFSDRRSAEALKNGLKLRRFDRDERNQYRSDSDSHYAARRPNRNKRFSRRVEGFSLAEASLKQNVRPSRFTQPTNSDATSSSDSQKNDEFSALASLDLVRLARKTSDRFARQPIFQALRNKIRKAAVVYAEGVLEFLPGGFGFLRCSANDFVTTADDVYVSPNQIRQLKLRPGSVVYGQTRPPKGQEKIFALLRVVSVDGLAPAEAKNRPNFSDLLARRASERLLLAQEDSSDAQSPLQTIEKFAPLCLGQRATVVAPSGEATQSFLYRLVTATLANNPDVVVVLLLHSADPKEVNARFNDSRCKVISSAASSEAWWKVHVANLAFERAKRLVESGRNVVVFCDSFDLLTTAWKEENDSSENWNRQWTEPVQQEASPKSLLGLARNIEDGGSLTVVAMTQPENGDAPAEFKGVADAAIFYDPETNAVDPQKSFSLSKADSVEPTESVNPA